MAERRGRSRRVHTIVASAEHAERLIDAARHAELEAWVRRHYRDRLVLDDLADAAPILGRSGGDAINVHRALPTHRERSDVQLAVSTDLPTKVVHAALIDLEITGSAARGMSGWYQP